MTPFSRWWVGWQTTRRAIGVVAIGTTIFAVVARGQDVVRTWSGETPDDSFASAIAVVDDLDGDGAREVLIGAPTASETFDQAGSAYLYSGADGHLLREWHGAHLDDLFGSSVCAADDADGDGVPDVVITAPGYAGSSSAGAAYLYSGSSGALVQELDGAHPGDAFGFVARRVDDLDGDGVRDLAISAFGESSLYLYSGRDGGLIRQIDSPQPTSGMGCSMASIRDLDGDGIGEVAVGAPFWQSSTGVTCGRAEVWSIAQGTLLQSHDGENQSLFANDFFGWSVAGLADVDGDGLDDFAVGAWGFGFGQEGRIYLYSGASGALLSEMDGPEPGDQAGWSLASAGDVDGDGAGDFCWGSPHRGASREGYVEFRSGATLAELTSVVGAPGDGVGVTLADAADVAGDGVAELPVGAIGPSTGYAGMAKLFALRPPRIDAIAPARGFYRDDTAITLTGGSFHLESGLSAWLDGTQATDTIVVDETTLTCTIPAGSPAIVDVELRSNLGSAHVPFLRTPSLTAGGDLRPGGQLDLSAFVNAHDSLLLIAGLPPVVSIPTPPFDGALAIDPFTTLLLIADVPSDELDFSLAIPDDSTMSGLTVLLQVLAGPKLGGRHKDGAWSNSVTVTVE